MATARRFVAVRPPTEVLDQLDALERIESPGVRWVPREQWHVTLRFLGEVERAPVIAALEHLRAQAVEARVGPRVRRLGRSVVCLPVEGLDGLAAAVTARTADIGEPAGPRPFAGHLTLARLRPGGRCALVGRPFSAGFAVHEIEVVRSQLDPAGARHTTELRVALGA